MANSRWRKRRGTIFSIGVSLLLFCFSLPTDGQETRPEGPEHVFSLQDCIKKATEVSPEIGEARYEEEVYRSKQLQAEGAAYPKIELQAVAGPSPEAKEKDFFKTDVASHTINGIFGKADVTLIQPIYTFGKISSYKEAAAKGIKVAEAGTRKRTSDIVLRTKELYYGLLLAQDLRNLILDVRDQLVDAAQKAEKQIEEGAPGADEVNLFKLKAFLGEADRNLNDADQGIAFAKDALMTSMGMSKAADFALADSSLTPEGKRPLELVDYTKLAPELRPEFAQLRDGLEARSALIKAERSFYYPNIFLGAAGSLAGATNRDKIENPYIIDYFNHANGAVFAGLQWSLDVGVTRGKVKEAEAEYKKLLEKKKFADEAIPLQVRKAYREFQEAEKNISATETAYKNAKKWLVAAAANFDLGLGEAKDIADAATAYAQMRANNLRSIYNHRIAFANLMYASGMDQKETR